MMGSKRRASRDMARMDGKHFSLDSVLTVLSFLILVVVVVIPMVMIVYNTFFYEGKFDVLLCTTKIISNIAETYLVCHTDDFDRIVSEAPLPPELPLKAARQDENAQE